VRIRLGRNADGAVAGGMAVNVIDAPRRRVAFGSLVVVNLEIRNVRVDDRYHNVILVRSRDRRDITSPPRPVILAALIDAALGKRKIDAQLVHVHALQ
jgi:hypothetical protein